MTADLNESAHEQQAIQWFAKLGFHALVNSGEILRPKLPSGELRVGAAVEIVEGV